MRTPTLLLALALTACVGGMPLDPVEAQMTAPTYETAAGDTLRLFSDGTYIAKNVAQPHVMPAPFDLVTYAGKPVELWVYGEWERAGSLLCARPIHVDSPFVCAGVGEESMLDDPSGAFLRDSRARTWVRL